MDRAFGFGPKGCRFESCRGHSVAGGGTSDGGSIPSESTDKTKKIAPPQTRFFCCFKISSGKFIVSPCPQERRCPEIPDAVFDVARHARPATEAFFEIDLVETSPAYPETTDILALDRCSSEKDRDSDTTRTRQFPRLPRRE